MFLFFESFQSQNVFILFLFSLKHSYLLVAKITLDINDYYFVSRKNKAIIYVLHTTFDLSLKASTKLM